MAAHDREETTEPHGVAPAARQPLSAQTNTKPHHPAWPGTDQIRDGAPGAGGPPDQESSLYTQDTSHTPWHLAPAPPNVRQAGIRPVKQATTGPRHLSARGRHAAHTKPNKKESK